MDVRGPERPGFPVRRRHDSENSAVGGKHTTDDARGVGWGWLEWKGKLVRLEGFEPPTNGFGSHYSIRLSYRRVGAILA